MKRILNIGLGVLLVFVLLVGAGAMLIPTRIQGNGLPVVYLSLDTDPATAGMQNTKSVQLYGGAAANYNGTDWSTARASSAVLYDVWGSSATDVFAVGANGTILHNVGGGWMPMTSNTPNTLRGVWGSSGTDVFAVGDSGTILHYNGTDWSAMTSNTANNLKDVWGASGTDVFAVGASGTIMHYDGSNWAAQTSNTANDLNGIWGSGAATATTPVIAVGNGGHVRKYDATAPGTWATMTNASTVNLNAVTGTIGGATTPDTTHRVVAVGDTGTIRTLSTPTSNWINSTSGSTTVLYGVWAADNSNYYAVGNAGKILKGTGTTPAWSKLTSNTDGNSADFKGVWGASSSSIFAVGSEVFLVKLWARTGTLTSPGGEVYVSYDKDVIEVTAVDQDYAPSEWAQLRMVEINNAGTQAAVDRGWSGGYTKVNAGGMAGNGALISGDREIGTLAFRAKATSASTSISYFDDNDAFNTMVNITIDESGTYVSKTEGVDYTLTKEGATVEASALPVIDITTPATDTTITAGGTISFVGSLVSGGPVTATNYKWDFNYNEGDTDVDATGLTPAAYGFGNVAGVYVVRFTATNGAGTSAPVTRTITVQPAVAHHLTVTWGGGSSHVMTAGASLELIIKAFDQYGNLNSSGANVYNGAKNLDFSGPVASPDVNTPTVEGTNVGSAVSVTFTNGVSNANAATLIAYKAETVDVDVSDATISSAGDPAYDLALTVGVAAANKLVYTQQPAAAGGATVDAALATQPIVEIRDQYGNLRSGDTATVTLNPVKASDNNTAGDGTLTGTSSKAAVAGVATFTDVGYRKLDTIHLKATSTGLTPANSTTDITLAPGTAVYFKVTESASGTSVATMTAGGTLELTVKAYDQYDNVATSYAGAKNLDFSGPAAAFAGNQPTVEGVNVVGSGTVSVTFTAGVSNANAATLAAFKAEEIGVDVSDGTISASQPLGLMVNAAAANFLEFNPTPATPVVAGATWTSFTVAIFDQYGNLTTSTANISVDTTSAGFSSGTTSKAATAGSASFADLTYNTAETITVSASSDGLTGATSPAVTVQPAAAHHLKVTESAGGTNAATMTAGGTLELTVKAYDQYDNLLSSGPNVYTGAKNLDFSGPVAAPAGNAPTVEAVNVVGTGTVSVTFTDGVSNANAATLAAFKAEGTAVDVSAGSIDSSGNDAWDLGLTVNVAALDHVVISPTNPTVVTTATQQFSASAEDVYNNNIADPVWAWSVTNASAGSIGGTGIFTAGTTFDTFADVVKAETTVNAVTKFATTGVTVQGATLSMSVVLQGDGRPIPEGEDYKGYNVPLTVKLYDQAVTNLNIKTLSPVTNGTKTGDDITITGADTGTKVITFSVTGLPVGAYGVTVYSPHTLVTYRSGVTINADNTGTTVVLGTLCEGDAQDIVAGSVVVDFTDFVAFGNAYETQSGMANWNANADFDRNGWVKIADFGLLYMNYGKTSPQTYVAP